LKDGNHKKTAKIVTASGILMFLKNASLCAAISVLFFCLIISQHLFSQDKEKLKQQYYRGLLDEGKALQESGRHTEAIKKFDEALPFFQYHPLILFAKAKSLQETGKLEDAMEIFQKISGKYEVQEYQKDIEERLIAISKILTPIRIFITVKNKVQPNIYIDGKLKGSTPLNSILYTGDHTIMLSLKGYRTIRKAITITPPGPFKKEYVLEPAKTGYLSIECTTLNADIFIDDIWIATTASKDAIELEDGEHMVRISKLGYAESISKVTIIPERTVPLYIELSKASFGDEFLMRKFDKPSTTFAWATLLGGIALFAAGTGFFVKNFIDKANMSSGGYGEIKYGSMTGSAEYHSDTKGSTNLILGGIMMAIGAGGGVASYFLFPDEKGAEKQ
jgi:hypothetical protein